MKLKELANALNLSQTTVSRALNDYPEVNEQTRLRVKTAAAYYGYRPNGAAKSLATGHTRTVACVIPDSSGGSLDQSAMGFVEGVLEACENTNLELRLLTDSRARKLLGSDTIADLAGAILYQPKQQLLNRVQRVKQPAITFGRLYGFDDSYSWVDFDHTAATLSATQHLLDLGHQRIALLNGPLDHNASQYRAQGFRCILENENIHKICYGKLSFWCGYDFTSRILLNVKSATAIITASTAAAWGVKTRLAESGLALGQDFSVIAFDDSSETQGEANQFTSIQMPMVSAGRETAEILVKSVLESDEHETAKLVRHRFLLGSSTGPKTDYWTGG